MRRNAIVLLLTCVVVLSSPARADWPMARSDATRSGYTPEPIAEKLVLRWVYKGDQRPQPAWPRSKRLRDDRAYHVVAAGGKVFFGSSADCHIHALDAETGREVWSFATDSPVRFAPALW